jgi:hypothetical protein
MITLPYSLVIEATEDPDFFAFYSADLDGFTGIGHSIEDCLITRVGEWPTMSRRCASKACQSQRRIQIRPS